MASSDFPGWILKALAGNPHDVNWGRSIPYIARVDDDLWTTGRVISAELDARHVCTLLSEPYGEETLPVAYDSLYTDATITSGTLE